MDLTPIVAKEVVSRLQKESSAGREVVCTQDLATLLVRIWIFGSPHTDATGSVGLTVEQTESLVDDIVNFVLKCSAPCLACLQLQCESYALKIALQQQRRTEEIKFEALTLRLLGNVLERDAGSSADEVLSDITLFIMHRYHQLSAREDSTSLAARRETMTLLCTVLPRRQVAAFTKQELVEKRRQVEDLGRIVWGIRLFNREEGKSAGAGLLDIHTLLEEPLMRLERQVSEALERVTERAKRTLAVLEAPTNVLPVSEQELLQNEYHHLQQIRQHLLLVRCMQQVLDSRVREEVFERQRTALTDLQRLLSDKATGKAHGEGGGDRAVAKQTVFPVFMVLADVYLAAMRAAQELEEANRLLERTLQSINAYPTTLPPHLASEAVQHISKEVPANRYELIREKVKQLLGSQVVAATLAESGLHVYYAVDLPSTSDSVVRACYPQSLYALNGYCPVRYCHSSFLVDGKVLDQTIDAASAGFLVVEGGRGRWALPRPLYFAFQSEDALCAFAADPHRYMGGILHGPCNHKEPSVMLVAGLVDLLPPELYLAGARVVEEEPSTKWVVTPEDGLTHRHTGKRFSTVEVGTQTGHMDSCKDHNYCWNEWQLRRQALKLVRLLDMRTHSTQTAASNFKRDASTQAKPPKELGIQTMPDAATQPPHVVQYLSGLRGKQSSRIVQVQHTIHY